eukprot:2960804-Pyramimonas_sp.AAC.1
MPIFMNKYIQTAPALDGFTAPGACGSLLLASWGQLGASRASDLEISVRGPPLGPFLGRSWGTPGLAGEPPGPFWGPLRGLMGRLGAI